MSEREEDPASVGQLREEAASWFARMRGPDAESIRPEFEAWLARSPLHRAAYNRATEIFAMGKLLGQHEERPSEAPQGVAPGQPGLVRGALLAVAAILLIIGVALIVRGRGDRILSGQAPGEKRGNGPALFATTGAGRAIRLSDGSRISLGAESKLAVAFYPDVRRLTLERGFARFEVAHELRPFVVNAGGGSVTAHGTIFEVAWTSGRRVSVRLIEGSVEVALPAPAPEKRTRDSRQLSRGQVLSFVAEGSSAAVAAPSANSTQSPPGRPAGAARDYDEVRLSDLIEQANRNSARPISLAPEIGERRISGRFRIDDTELLAERLAALFNLSEERTKESILLRPR